jgi:hypothetical protein
MKRFCGIWCAMLVCLLLSACAATVKEVVNDRPAWIDNPGNGVSASAGMHVRGKVAQEELAIQRARVEYAKRFGVNVQSAQMFSTIVANGKANTVGTQVAREDSQQLDVKAVVKAKWRDPENDVVWVWLVPSDQ